MFRVNRDCLYESRGWFNENECRDCCEILCKFCDNAIYDEDYMCMECSDFNCCKDCFTVKKCCVLVEDIYDGDGMNCVKCMEEKIENIKDRLSRAKNVFNKHKVKCECGKMVRRDTMKQHIKRKVHLRNI